MKRVLNVSVCQTDVLWEDPDGNRMRLERLVNGHMRSLRQGLRPDLIVLPDYSQYGVCGVCVRAYFAMDVRYCV